MSETGTGAGACGPETRPSRKERGRTGRGTVTALLLFCWSELTWGVGGNQDWLGWAGWHLVLWCAAADSMGGMREGGIRWDFGVEGKGRVPAQTRHSPVTSASPIALGWCNRWCWSSECKVCGLLLKEACRCWGALARASTTATSQQTLGQPEHTLPEKREGEQETAQRETSLLCGSRRAWREETTGDSKAKARGFRKTGYEGTSTYLELVPKGGGHFDMSGYGSPISPLAQKCGCLRQTRFQAATRQEMARLMKD